MVPRPIHCRLQWLRPQLYHKVYLLRLLWQCLLGQCQLLQRPLLLLQMGIPCQLIISINPNRNSRQWLQLHLCNNSSRRPSHQQFHNVHQFRGCSMHLPRRLLMDSLRWGHNNQWRDLLNLCSIRSWRSNSKLRRGLSL